MISSAYCSNLSFERDCKMMLYLSKSKYCSAIQCPKMLWLKKYRPEEFDNSVMNETVLRTGNEVGDLAMGLLGDFREVPYGDLDEMLRITKEWMSSGVSVIAEASFAYEGLFCSVDILKRINEKEVEIYEVKSSTSIKEINYHDVAYQYYVLTKLGYHVNRVFLVHINNMYERLGPLDLNALFTLNDVTKDAESMMPGVASMIQFLIEYMSVTDEPKQSIGEQCFDPYDCGFWKYCTKDFPHPNVFDIGGLQKKSKFELYRDGVLSFDQLEIDGRLKRQYMKQVKHELHNLETEIHKEVVRKFLDELSYPLYFLDFETMQPAIPRFDHSRPYEQIPFQYSLHYIEKENGEYLHTEFLAEPDTDPRRSVAVHLCDDIPENVCVMAYNMGFEKGRIRRMAELYPDLSNHLMAIHDHIVDLMVPFRQKAFYCKEMRGSYSIKYVLPALFPNDPELDYHNLTDVHNGTEASDTFSRMRDMNSEEREQCRINLLKYCRLDTWAMVKIWERLKEIDKFCPIRNSKI